MTIYEYNLLGCRQTTSYGRRVLNDSGETSRDCARTTYLHFGLCYVLNVSYSEGSLHYVRLGQGTIRSDI